MSAADLRARAHILMAEAHGLLAQAEREAPTTSSMTPATSAPLLSKQALAQALSVSVAAVDRLDRDGRITHVLVGDVRRYDLAGVLAALSTAPKVEPARGGVVRRLRAGGS